MYTHNRDSKTKQKHLDSELVYAREALAELGEILI